MYTASHAALFLELGCLQPPFHAGYLTSIGSLGLPIRHSCGAKYSGRVLGLRQVD